MALKNVFNFHNMKILFVYYTLWTNQDLFHQIIILSSLKYIYSKQFVGYDEVGLASVAKWSKSLTYYYQLIINGGTSPRNEKLNLLVQIKFLNLLAHRAKGNVSFCRPLTFHILIFSSETP